MKYNKFENNMVNNNIPPVEEIRYLSTEIPSYEEFMKTYKFDEKVNASYESEISACGDLGVEMGYGPMPRWWCIKCQSEQDHEYDYCHNSCGNNCVHRCKNCKLETLANISEPSVGDGSGDAVRQAVAQAQRQALATNKTSGVIEINMSCGNAGDGYYRTQILMYDTRTKDYRVAYRS